MELRFQMLEVTGADEADIADIIDELEALVGSGVNVDATREIVTERDVSPSDGVCWTFLAHI